ncbi:MAG: hypothetical protein ACM3VW_04525 [Bacteroidota bacterium]
MVLAALSLAQADDAPSVRVGAYGQSDPSAELVARAMAATAGAEAVKDDRMLQLVGKGLQRLCRKRPPSTGAAPSEFESTSMFYLPESSINRRAPGHLSRMTLWRGSF